MSDLVWYVSYGSNLHGARFACYLFGGQPRGARRAYAGSVDRSPVIESRPMVIPHRMYFFGDAPVWGGGGVSMLDPQVGAGFALARGYLITRRQFEDVVAQENGRDHAAIEDLPGPGQTFDLGPGWYETLLGLDPVDGVPAVTFTAPWTLAQVSPSQPSPVYLATLAGGLVEAHDVSWSEALDYLCSCPGALEVDPESVPRWF